jgi:hypothetical protein
MRTSSLLALLVVLTLAVSCSRRSSMTGMWTGTHQIDSSTDGPTSFNSRPSKTYGKLTESRGQLTGSITQFGTDSQGFINTEALHGTISRQVVEWTSGKSWQTGQKKYQYQSVFHGTLNGDTITGRFSQTWDADGKKTTYEGPVTLTKQPGKH